MKYVLLEKNKISFANTPPTLEHGVDTFPGTNNRQLKSKAP